MAPPMKILLLWLQCLLLNAQTFQSLRTHLIAPGRLISVSCKQDNPLVSPRATSNFTTDGKLILENGRGETKAIANIPTAPTASKLDSGNSVLLDNKSTVIWDSFDHPTDTIWGGRGLIANRKLASGASPLDHLSGRFFLIMQSGENLVVYPVSFSAYWASESDTFVYQASKGRSDTFPYLDPETELLSLHHSNATFRFLTLTTYQARFGPDGSFVLYSHSFCVDGNVTVVEEWSALEGLKAYSKFNVALEDCRQKCLDDCNCWVSLFDNGTCDKYKLAVMSAIPNLKNSVTALVKSVSPGNPIVSSEPKIVVQRKKILCFDSLNGEFTLRSFSYDELETSTDGFKEILRRNACEAAYKGNLSEEGESKFRAEITPVGQTHERNLVRLLGFCIEGSRNLLVYEFMNNCSFSKLFVQGRHLKIYFLDDSWIAKESDSGLAKLLMTKQSGTLTGAKGSNGYMAPEWEKDHMLEVDDVPTGDEPLRLDWIYHRFSTTDLKNLDGDEEVDMKGLGRMVNVRLFCAQDDANQWPAMKDVILLLEGTVNIPEPRPLVAC
ncbi:Serine/threonine protein kinase [Handroanthus impetiginosus]|uniref:Serine/threonine protein kinase n=1 Tax=Handroanthus impetiginosus TaxID=429701 RepID=A0A2G9H5D4_9LAMI|nr:Serine/threonine protein kinase [Handroanthus impetiginosus]